MQAAQLKWWRDEIGCRLLVDVTPSLLAECRDKLLSQPTHQSEQRAPATTVRYMAALSHAFTIAVNEWGWLEDNPLRKVKKPKEPRGRVRYLDDDERERLLKACQESKTGILHTVVMVAIATGMRKGEIMGLKWPDVDLARGRLTLHDTKNGERRVVPIAGKALELMKAHNKIRRLGVAWVFPSHNGKNPAGIVIAWNNAIERAGIDNFHFHDLRHSTASYLATNGASLGEIADILGHKTLQMVKRYAHLSDSHVAGVLEDMNKKIFGE